MGHDHERGHTHGAGARLEPEARAVLARGLGELLRLTEGLAFRDLNSEKYPLPLARAVYSGPPEPEAVRRDVAARRETDPVSVLEYALVLLELLESNEADTRDLLLDDMAFIRACFNSKRCSGWMAVVGGDDREAVEAAVTARRQFRLYNGPARPTGVYVLANMLARYAAVYGRIRPGDFHALGHFVEEFTPGLLVCRAPMTDLELTLSLAVMKMGVPALVPPDYPFPLGRVLRVEPLDQLPEAAVAFPNIRRLLVMPEVPGLPPYCDPENSKETVEAKVTWGATPESFYLLRKGAVGEPGVIVRGEPGEAMGVLVTVDAEPMDAFDCRYIERQIVPALATMRGGGRPL